MKQTIMEKVANGEELSNDEFIYLGRNLPEAAGTLPIPFDHTHKRTFEACGVTQDDMNSFVDKLKEITEQEKSREDRALSKLVEALENYFVSSDKNKRMFVCYFVKSMSDDNPILGLLRGLIR